jgi:acyl-ACP thioesterase
MQQIAGEHAEKLGVGFDRMQAEGLAWVLARWQVSLERMPLPGETITLETWPSAVERLQCRREFIMRDASQAVLVRGGSWWVVVNTNTFRLQKPPPQLVAICPPETEFAQEDFSFRLPQVKEGQKTIAAPVRWSDIDVNQHVNNASYLDWVLQSVPVSEGRSCLSAGLRRFEINFKSEARLGDMLEARCEALPDKPGMFAHSVYNLADSKEVVRAFTEWNLV